MKRATLFFILLLCACGKETGKVRAPGPFNVPTPGPSTWDPNVTPPANWQVTLKYKTGTVDCAGGPVEIPSAQMGAVFENVCHQGGKCTFSRMPGHPYPEFVFQITTTVVDPLDTTPGLCDWTPPEAI